MDTYYWQDVSKPNVFSGSFYPTMNVENLTDNQLVNKALFKWSCDLLMSNVTDKQDVFVQDNIYCCYLMTISLSLKSALFIAKTALILNIFSLKIKSRNSSVYVKDENKVLLGLEWVLL